MAFANVGRTANPACSVNVIGESGNTFALELVRHFPTFKFSGDRADFSAFQDQWEDYIQLIRQLAGESLSPYVQLSLLREKMDDVTGREIALRMRDPLVKYDEVYAEICRRFGIEAGLYRHRWKRLRLQRSANGVSPAEWRRFRVELSAMAQGFGDDETAVREHVLLQLPESWRLAVIKQEMRRKVNSNMVRVWVPQGRKVSSIS